MAPETRVTPAKRFQEPVEQPKKSAVEGVKEQSRYLRGTIADELAKDTDHFSEADKQLLKFHGTYQQEDRDARKHRAKQGVGKHYMFMVRCKIPGGRVSAKQYLALDKLAENYANGTLRITSRQGIQFHGVLKANLKNTIAGINDTLLTTLGACGDVNRNVMACPAPHHHDAVHDQLQETAAILAAHFAPRTAAYHEVWLNGKRLDNGVPDIEPIYGKAYLPRKFKIGLALPEDNCIDVYSQDLGLLAIAEDGNIVGFNVLVGGGSGRTHGNSNTFPHLAKPICYVPAKAVVNISEAVVRLFRDHGNRADRKQARIKYVVHHWGVEKFRKVLADYAGGALLPPKEVDVTGFDNHLGWQPQGDGKWYYGVCVENGRIKDEGDFRLRTALRTIVEQLEPEIRLTPQQDILFCNLASDAKATIERILTEHHVRLPDQISVVQRYSMACPAIPTCGLAISESERALPGIIDQLETELQRLGLQDEKISVRMTGCPNGCVRPYQSDIGIVGRSGDKYMLFVGGNLLGTRLNFELRDLVPLKEIVPTLTPILESFKRDRLANEGFGDFCCRLGLEKLEALMPDAAGKKPKINEANGNTRLAAPEWQPGNDATPALPAPQTQTVPLELPVPQVESGSLIACKETETFFVGPKGEERRDFAYRYNDDDSVRETIVYFYEEDRRAAEATADHALRREAIYAGRVNPLRLHAARKLRDLYYVGPAGHERIDRCILYRADGQPAQTIVYLYDGDRGAADVSSGSPVRRQIAIRNP